MNDQGFVEAQHALTLIQKYLGPTFTLTQLLDFIAFCREKDGVRVEEQSLPIGKWAYCFAFQDVDLIVVREGLEPLRWLQACLHECAHFLLRHIPRVSAGPTTTTFAEFQRGGELCQAVYQALGDDDENLYSRPQEWAAETLATLLLACMSTGENGMPQLARDLYGDE